MGLYGPRGWSVRAGIWRILRNHITPDPSTALDDDGAPTSDYVDLRDIGPTTARQLLDAMPDDALTDTHNAAPILGDLLHACIASQGRLRLHGYGIGPQRNDERVAVDAVWIETPNTAAIDPQRVWPVIANHYGLTSRRDPDEATPRRRFNDHGPEGMWLWWD